jgi:biopolymer transport protein ExbD
MGAVDLGAPKGGQKKKKGLHRPKRRVGVRIDMTPMVDIAFLLLIFYMVSTIFAEPQAMEINLPPKGTEEVVKNVKESELMTLRVDAKDRIFWAMGTDKPDTVSLSRLPQLLIDSLYSMPKMITVVKINKAAHYSRMVDVLDRIEVVEYRIKARQKAQWDRQGGKPAGEDEFSYVFSMAPWTRLDTKMVAQATGEAEAAEEGT